MKHSIQIFVIALCAMIFVAPACKNGKDKDEPRPALTAFNVIGHFLGNQNTNVSVMGAVVPVESNDVIVEIEREEGGFLSIEVENFTYNGDNYGDIELERAEIVSADADKLVFKGTGFCKLEKKGREFIAQINSLEGTYDVATQSVVINIDMTLKVSDQMTIGFSIVYNGRK